MGRGCMGRAEERMGQGTMGGLASGRRTITAALVLGAATTLAALWPSTSRAIPPAQDAGAAEPPGCGEDGHHDEPDRPASENFAA